MVIVSISGTSVKNSDQGFTLAESLVAIVVLGITLSAGMAFFFHANELYYRGLHLRQATFVAETKMEQIKNAGCAATSAETGVGVAIGAIGGYRDVVRPVTCMPTSNDMRVRVYWQEPGDTSVREVNLETLVGP
jgi:prepilin-type N-terminal cleavage/methylation domain-containing protein